MPPTAAQPEAPGGGDHFACGVRGECCGATWPLVVGPLKVTEGRIAPPFHFRFGRLCVQPAQRSTAGPDSDSLSRCSVPAVTLPLLSSNGSLTKRCQVSRTPAWWAGGGFFARPLSQHGRDTVQQRAAPENEAVVYDVLAYTKYVCILIVRLLDLTEK